MIDTGEKVRQEQDKKKKSKPNIHWIETIAVPTQREKQKKQITDKGSTIRPTTAFSTLKYLEDNGIFTRF